MKVYTHYPALAPAIRRAGYEPVLLEPVTFDEGPVKMAIIQQGPDAVVVVTAPSSPPITFCRTGPEMLEVVR